VISAQGNRYRACLDNFLYGCLERRQSDFDVAGVHLHITGVVDLQISQTIGSQRQRGPRSVVWQIIGHPDGLRPEAGTGAVGGASVERRSQDHNIGIRIAGLVVKIALWHA
jgi:hypothetical protein